MSGRLFYNTETGKAGCVHCGWSGVPIFLKGKRSDYCPACQHEPDQVRTSRPQQRHRSKDKRKAQRAARKRNR